MDKELLEYMEQVTNYYTRPNKYTAQEIANMFVAKEKDNNTSNITQEENTFSQMTKDNINTTSYFLDMDELSKWKNKNNSKFEVRSHNLITSHRKVIGGLLVRGKKFVRKMLKWYIDPIVEQQNEFNGSVTASINALYNSQLVLNKFIHDTMESISYLKHEMADGTKRNLELEELEHQIKSINLGTEAVAQSIQETEYDLQQIKPQLEKLNQLEQSVKEYYAQMVNQQEGFNNKLDEETCKNITKISEIEALLNKKVDCQANAYKAKIEEVEDLLDKTQESIHYMTYKLNKIKQRGIKVELTQRQVADHNVEIKEDGLDYFLFENKFRGTEKSIKASQKQYLKYYLDHQNVLDIGSGRGEFLELLNEKNISCTGIDVYEEFVEYCIDKGLNAIHGDALDYVRNQEDLSLGGVFMGQVAEHLDSNYLLNLIKVCYAKMKQGAYFVAETPNPTNLTTFTNNFYLDPSHIKPVHPQTFKFLLEYAGFKEVEIIYTDNSRSDYRLPLINGSSITNLEEVNSGINLMSDLVFGSLDYAIAAKK